MIYGLLTSLSFQALDERYWNQRSPLACVGRHPAPLHLVRPPTLPGHPLHPTPAYPFRARKGEMKP